MATLADVQTALADQIRTAFAAVTDVAVQVEGRMVLNPTPPTVDMWPASPSVDQEMASFGEIVGGRVLNVRARVTTADHEAGQDLLLALMDDEDPLSLVAALDDDPTVGGRVTSLDVRGDTGFVLVPDPGGAGELLGCVWTVVLVKAES